VESDERFTKKKLRQATAREEGGRAQVRGRRARGNESLIQMMALAKMLSGWGARF
jgi:hypothetical protein